MCPNSLAVGNHWVSASCRIRIILRGFRHLQHDRETTARRQYTRLLASTAHFQCDCDAFQGAACTLPNVNCRIGLTRTLVGSPPATAFRCFPARNKLTVTRRALRLPRSEERRVGKEGRSRWSPHH